MNQEGDSHEEELPYDEILAKTEADKAAALEEGKPEQDDDQARRTLEEEQRRQQEILDELDPSEVPDDGEPQA